METADRRGEGLFSKWIQERGDVQQKSCETQKQENQRIADDENRMLPENRGNSFAFQNGVACSIRRDYNQGRPPATSPKGLSLPERWG